MSVATSTAIGIAGAVGAAGSIGSSLIGGSAANKAASAQAQAAEFAAQLQYQEAQQALGFQEQQYANTLGLEEPGYLTGNESLGTLAQLMGLTPQVANTSIFSNPFGMNGAPTGVNPGFGSPTALPGAVNPGVGGGIGPIPMQAQDAAAIEGFGNPSNPTNFGNGALDFNPPAGDFTSPNPRFTGLNQPGGIQGGPVRFNPPGGGIQDPHTPPQPINFNGNPAQTTVPTSPGTIGNTGLPQGFLAQTWNTPFVAPTADQAAQMPGYQFQLQQGQQALENSAAARGGLLSGGTAKALDQYSQGLASTDYQNLYNQALTQYQQAYNIFNQNQSNIFNRYAALAGIGQTSAQQLSNAGLTTGSNVANTLLSSGAQIGGDIQNAAAARASGYVGAANAYGGALSNLGGLAQLLPLYSSLRQSSPTALTPGIDTGNPNTIGSPGSTIFD